MCMQVATKVGSSGWAAIYFQPYRMGPVWGRGYECDLVHTQKDKLSQSKHTWGSPYYTPKGI